MNRIPHSPLSSRRTAWRRLATWIFLLAGLACCTAAAGLVSANEPSADGNGTGTAAPAGHASDEHPITLREQELNTRLGVGYAVRILDMNADRRPDIVVVDQKRILWLENPNWNEHTLVEDKSKPNDNVCFAPHDIDGDGRVDFALGADWQFSNTQSGGTIQWVQNTPPGRPSRVHDISSEPTVHRMRFVDLDSDGQPELVVAPLMGRGTTRPDFQEAGVRLLAFSIPSDPVRDPWPRKVISDEMHVTHNFWPTDLNGDGQLELLVASFEGVNLLERRDDGTWRRTRIGTGDQQSAPNRGASEIKHGRLRDKADYIATIEPWHGNQVVVYTRPDGARPTEGEWLWNRQVLDDQLKWGHAVWCADLDQDGDQELIIGVRDDLSDTARRGLRVYDPRDGGKSWKRYVIDPGSVAIEDLAAEDLNGDGRIDIVAVGRQTHNVKIYWNETKRDPSGAK